MENPTKIKKVLLIANIANVQKFISPSSGKYCGTGPTEGFGSSKSSTCSISITVRERN